MFSSSAVAPAKDLLAGQVLGRRRPPAAVREQRFRARRGQRVICLGCHHAQPKKNAAPTFRRMIASHIRALLRAHDSGELAGQIAVAAESVSLRGPGAVRVRCRRDLRRSRPLAVTRNGAAEKPGIFRRVCGELRKSRNLHDSCVGLMFQVCE